MELLIVNIQPECLINKKVYNFIQMLKTKHNSFEFVVCFRLVFKKRKKKEKETFPTNRERSGSDVNSS